MYRHLLSSAVAIAVIIPTLIDSADAMMLLGRGIPNGLSMNSPTHIGTFSGGAHAIKAALNHPRRPCLPSVVTTHRCGA